MTSPAPPPSCSKTGAPSSRYCLCAPTTHPGSFRCRLHRSPPAAKVTAPPSGSEAVKEAAAAAAARGLLARVKRKPRQPGVSGIIRPGPSRLGVRDDEQADDADSYAKSILQAGIPIPAKAYRVDRINDHQKKLHMLDSQMKGLRWEALWVQATEKANTNLISI
ncbi:hypothetical protein EJB05_52513, partial [Eragrostis curvula]